MYPRWQALAQNGELAERARTAVAMLARCRLCPRACEVDRLAERRGYCRTGRHAVVASWGAHYGEEAALVGRHGSGTVFFSNCNLGCVFCQNHDISHGGSGRALVCDELARVFLAVQQEGCHNLNLVSPTHVVPQILEALVEAAARGFRLPLVWNCGGWESTEALALLDGVVDIYMPDAKYQDDAVAERLSRAPAYGDVCRAALREMHRQVGDLRVDGRGVVRAGLLVRHLVLPGGLAGTSAFAEFLAAEVSPDTYVNVMSQYRPAYRAREFAEISRATSRSEWAEAVEMCRAAGLLRLDPRD